MRDSAANLPPPLPQVRPPSQLQRLLAQLTMGRPGNRDRVYRALASRGDEALKALDALFPGRLFLDGDLASLFVEPLEEIAPLLEALKHFGSNGLAVLERHATDPDPNHRLAVARALLDFPHALAGRTLARLAADAESRVARGACLALTSGRHPGGLARAREAAVSTLEARQLDDEGAWSRCVWLEAGRALAIAATASWRRVKTHTDALGALSWHPPGHQRELLEHLRRNLELPLARVRVLALTHPERAVRAFAVDAIGRSPLAALAFDPDGAESFRKTVAERYKGAAFD